MPSHYRLFFYQKLPIRIHYVASWIFRVLSWPSKIVKNTSKSSNHRNTHTAIALLVRIFANYKYGYKRKRIYHIDLATAESQFLKKFCFSRKFAKTLTESRFYVWKIPKSSIFLNFLTNFLHFSFWNLLYYLCKEDLLWISSKNIPSNKTNPL